MKKTKELIKENIILAAIECTERKGIHAVNIRDIAKQADVNVAAINYYFGTKEELLKEMLTFTLYTTLAENIEEIEKAHQNPYAMMKALLLDIFQGALRFPNISKAHIYGPLVNNDYGGVFVEWLNEFLSRLADRVTTVKSSAAEKKHIKFAVAQMISTILFLGLMPNLFDQFFHGTIKDSPKKQEEYVEQMLKHYLGAPRASKKS